MTGDLVGAVHHIELWVPHFEAAEREWGWLLPRLGYESFQSWPNGCSWRLGPTYIVVEKSPDLSGSIHERTSPGLNHLAFHAGTRDQVNTMATGGAESGWTQLFREKFPHAGGADHYAAYLVNSDGFEVELIATG
jgi:hypothetical protein